MLTLEELKEKIKKANRDYYLLGESELSDAEYDSLVEELRLRDPSCDLLNKIGDDSQSDNKVLLPNCMFSLNKVRPDFDLSSLYDNEDIICMPKLDGLSIQIEYDENGNYSRMYTRGNGIYGQDITARGKYMPFPKKINSFNKKLYVTGECVISKENFKLKKGEYKHQRNMVGGVLRPILTNLEFENILDDNLKYNLGLLDFVAWDCFGLNCVKLSEKINILYFDLGFKAVNDYDVFHCKELDEQTIIKKIKYYKDYCPYLTDGLVVKLNNIIKYESLGKEPNFNPKGGRAIKLDINDQFSLIGEIKDIEWNITKRGIFTPVVILKDPLNFDGAEVTRVTGVNLNYVKNLKLAVGNKVKVIRSGDVIPRIIDTKVINNNITYPKRCPYCSEILLENDANLYCPNNKCNGKERASIINFFIALDLEDISFETLANLYDNGFNSYEKILSITYKDLINLEGYQAAKSLKVQKELNSCLKDITLEKVMYASQLFQDEKTSLGETKLKWVIDAYGKDNILASLNNEVDSTGKFKSLNPEILKNIKGFGEASQIIFKNNYVNFKKFYARIKNFITFYTPKVVGNKLKGKIFAFTQFRDPSLEKIIEENGGEIKGVSKKCYVLFSAGESTKTQTAIKYGIKIVHQSEAKDFILKLLKEGNNELQS